MNHKHHHKHHNPKSKHHHTKTILPFLLTGILLAAIIISGTALLLSRIFNNNDTSNDPVSEADPRPVITETRGVFVPTVYNLSFPSKADLSADELKEELDEIVETSKKAGLNSIFFQVRPSCDALYASNFFPVSSVLSSTGEMQFDCLKYLQEKCHSEGMAIHAWVNPLRVSASAMTLDELPDGSPAKNPEYNVITYDGKLYFDAGDPDVRQLICNGVRELCENYTLDGIVFDDYFYPYTAYETDENGNKVALAFNDEESYSVYGAEFDELGDYRRSNINMLIESVYSTVKLTDNKCLFGVSCFGIWKNSDGDNGGSITKGSESYNEIFCDTLAWIEGGYVDYIAPQIYWSCDSVVASYKVLSKWWDMNVTDTNVDLLIAHAAYKYDGTFDSASKEMTNQLTLTEELLNYKGSIFYSYNALRDNIEGITDELSSYYISKDTSPEQ